ncbi:MAG: hypothetical protein KJP16_06070 [Gammaproteobacteria bacterium]|nr:hypothetical protein [Gammaproteobacteria bacterium]NNL50369.1 hypothetical protein [Woeseiaceae bacterium]
MGNQRHNLVLPVSAVFLLWFVATNAGAPPGWSLAGSKPQAYEIGVESAGESGSSAFLRSRVENTGGFGTLMQTFSAEIYRGKRLRMTGMAKATDVENWAGLWMRIEGSDQEKMLGFDNMQDRPIVGSTEWQEYSVVLDVPDESKAIAFGILLIGSGKVLLDNIRFDEVGEDIAVTGSSERLPIEPSNLDFETK